MADKKLSANTKAKTGESTMILLSQKIKGMPVNQVKELKGKLLKGTKQIKGLTYHQGRGKVPGLYRIYINLNRNSRALIFRTLAHELAHAWQQEQEDSLSREDQERLTNLLNPTTNQDEERDWVLIRQETAKGNLGTKAFVSTKRTSQNKYRLSIYVNDNPNQAGVAQIIEKLIELGFNESEIKNPHLNPNHFEIRERGLSYQGAKRIDFYDLFSYQRARGAIARTVYQEIVFEEAIPIDQEFLYVGANPYLFSAWFLDVFPNLHKLRKAAEELKAKNDNSGVLAIAQDENGVEWLLYLNLIEGEHDAHSLSLEEKINPSTVNWDEFMIDEPKKYQILYSLQDFFFCELGERKAHKKYCLMYFTKNRKETDSTLINFCFSWEAVAKSKLKNCRLRKKEDLIKK
ncbi:1241_t:CDS:2 [Entrophospora sp. SA101]|nr:1241_t:CDS:2 [Entrophospora sp. SA101]